MCNLASKGNQSSHLETTRKTCFPRWKPRKHVMSHVEPPPFVSHFGGNQTVRPNPSLRQSRKSPACLLCQQLRLHFAEQFTATDLLPKGNPSLSFPRAVGKEETSISQRKRAYGTNKTSLVVLLPIAGEVTTSKHQTQETFGAHRAPLLCLLHSGLCASAFGSQAARASLSSANHKIRSFPRLFTP